jgi:predicted secreted hydrolase
VTRGRQLFALLVVLAAVAAPASEWATVTAPLTLSLPRDHAAHPEFQTEWWYVTGTLADGVGNPFGFQLTFFRQGLDPSPPNPGASALRARQVLAGHFAVADIGAGKVLFAQRVRRIAAGLAFVATDDLHVVLDDWEMQRLATGVVSLSAEDRDAGTGIRLELIPEKPLVLHGDRGVSVKGSGPGNASAYVSFTRLTARGTLTLGGRRLVVHGEAWLDHEWGTSQLGPGVVGWDWLGLRLADGREVMLYRLRRADGRPAPESGGTLVERDGRTRRLSAADFTLEPESSWTSPRSGARYPARLRVRLPLAGLDLEVRPEVADAEIDARASTATVYWEGPVAVTGTVAGQGYVELTGYAGSMVGRF